MLSRRAFCGGAVSAATLSAQRTKPNFVFILADDHAGYAMHCDGDRRAETPNLDKLASEGTRFAAHYCNSPVCTPSRQSFLTGLMPHATGVTTLRTSLDPEKPTIAKQLKKAGYRTAVFGKMHFNRPGQPGLYGFDHMMTEREINQAWPREGGEPATGVKTKKLPWQPFRDPARVWLNADNLPYPRVRDHMRSAFQLQQVRAYLEQNTSDPLALWVSFQEPHSPFDFPVEDRKFSGPDFDPPQPGKEDAWQIPLIFRDLSRTDKQGINAAYYNSVRYLDQNIGRLIQMLMDQGRWENTFIVYMADHGYCLGHHGRFEKHCGFDPALRVPLIMRWPGKIRGGHVVRGLTESVDVPHTILDMLEAPELPVKHGQSLRPYLGGADPSNSRTHIFSEYLENEEAFVRTAAHKFLFCSGKRKRLDGYETEKPTPGRYVRLYDLKKDPGELTDIASGNPKIVAEMQRIMMERFRATHPEASQEPAGTTEERLDWYLRPRDGETSAA
jgi:arylsulfatase A-like enzyme